MRERTSEREKFYISFDASRDEIDKGIEVLGLWREAYPRDVTPRINLSRQYGIDDEHEKGIEAAGEALRLDPNAASTYGNLGLFFLYLNRFDEARAILEQGVEKRSIIPTFTIIFMYLPSFRETRRQCSGRWTGQTEAAEGPMLFAQAHAASFYGQRRKIRRTFSPLGGGQRAIWFERGGGVGSGRLCSLERGVRGLSANESEHCERP